MNSKEYVLGIDGGGTHLRVNAACIEDARCLGKIDFPSLGYFFKDEDSSVRHIQNAINNCIEQFNGSVEDCRYVVCGMSGIDSEEDKKLLCDLFSMVLPHTYSIDCMNDAELAFYAIVGNSGILMNSGTGSIAFGINAKGRKARVGGWPYTVYGDEGSGSWIALKSLRAVGMWFDGVIDRKSELVRLILEELKITKEKEYLDFCLNYSLKNLVSIPLLVNQACICGDKVALEIMDAAILESFKLIKQLTEILGYSRDDHFKIGLWGSNVLNNSFHLHGLYSQIMEEYPKSEICLSKNDSLTFATCLATNRVKSIDKNCRRTG